MAGEKPRHGCPGDSPILRSRGRHLHSPRAPMKLRNTPEGVIAEDRQRGRWVALPQERDMLDAPRRRRGGPDRRPKRDRSRATRRSPTPAPPGCPSRRARCAPSCSGSRTTIASAGCWSSTSSRRPVAKAVAGFERVTGRTFPKLKPNKRFYETPAFYVANHAAVLADGEEMWWPRHTKYLDFELELAFVLAQPLADATPAEAARGGRRLVRPQRLERPRRPGRGRCATNIFGPVGEVEDLRQLDRLRRAHRRRAARLAGGDRAGAGRRRGLVRGRRRPAPPTTSARCSPTPRPASGSSPATSISTGTMPGCCGLELDRWIRPGQTVELEIDGIGTLSNRIGARR